MSLSWLSVDYPGNPGDYSDYPSEYLDRTGDYSDHPGDHPDHPVDNNIPFMHKGLEMVLCD